MTDRYPNAILFSAILHAAAVGVLLLCTYLLHQRELVPVKSFELVAGEGDNFAATEAPALGVPGGVTLTVPETPAPVAAPEPQPQPVPAQMQAVQAPPEPVLTKAPTPPPKAAETIPDLTKAVKRTAARKEAVLEKKYKAEEAKKAKEELARMTKAEYDAKNKAKSTPTSTASNAPKVARIDGEGIAKGVIGGSTSNKTGGAGGKALTRTDGSDLEAWEAMLKQRLRENLEKPPGLSDTLVAVVVVRTGADGSLTNAKISKSSGSPEFDQAVLDAVARTTMRPRPDNRSETLSIPFRMRDEAN